MNVTHLVQTYGASNFGQKFDANGLSWSAVAAKLLRNHLNVIITRQYFSYSLQLQSKL